MEATLGPIEIFRAGTHTAMDGRTLTFAESDLGAAAAAYDPARHEAPIVVGHPTHDAPAYGWVAALSFTEGALRARLRQVDPAFAEMVAAGRFKKVSASFYLPGSPANPQPGAFYLRHVGLLGAMPPAVKGLRPVAFAAGEEGVVTIEFAEPESAAGATQPDQDKVKEMPKEAMPRAAADAADEALRAERQQLAADRAALERDRAAFAESKTRDEAAAFVAGLVKEGKVLPAEADGLVSFIAGLDAGGMVDFTEGGRAVKQTRPDFIKGFLAGLSRRIEFGEIAKDDAGPGTIEFAAAPGFSAPAEGLELHGRALAFQRAHPGTDYLAAVKAVSAR